MIKIRTKTGLDVGEVKSIAIYYLVTLYELRMPGGSSPCGSRKKLSAKGLEFLADVINEDFTVSFITDIEFLGIFYVNLFCIKQRNSLHFLDSFLSLIKCSPLKTTKLFAQ
jgi:hypothetical protein